jgi:hypothetical protein
VPEKPDNTDEQRIKPLYEVRFPIKAGVFVMAVITLSWFFEGWRKIHESLSFTHVGLLIFGALSTIFLILVMSFWIYAEEKQKGSLVRSNALFEKLYQLLMKRAAAKTEGG